MTTYFPLKKILKNNEIIIIDGLNRVGKLLLGSLICSFNKMEHLEFGDNFEHLLPAVKLKKIKIDFANAYLNNYLNELIYNKYISRNVNFRPYDRTGVAQGRDPKIYKKRLKLTEGNQIISKIKSEQKFLPIVTHQLAVNLDVLKKMNMNFKIIEIIRNPIDTAYSWFKRGYGVRFGKDQRFFTLLIKKNSKVSPWYNGISGYKNLKLNPCDSCVYHVINLVNHSVNQLKKNSLKKNITITSYEELTNNTLKELNRISKFIGTKTNKKTIEFMKRENCPNTNQKLELIKLNNKKKFLKKSCSKKIFNDLIKLQKKYEKNYYGLKMFK